MRPAGEVTDPGDIGSGRRDRGPGRRDRAGIGLRGDVDPPAVPGDEEDPVTELAPRPAQPSQHPLPGPARSGLRVVRLIRGERPLERAATAGRRLVGMVGAMDVACGLVLTLGAGCGSANQLTIHTEGEVAEDWEDDVAWSLEGIARLEPWTVVASPAPAYVAEMRTVRDIEPLPAAFDEEAETRDLAFGEIRRQRMLREITPHPQALVVDLADLLAGNLGRGSRRLRARRTAPVERGPPDRAAHGH